MRVIKEIAFNAPDFVIHLLPFGARIDVDLHVRHFEYAFAWFERGVRRGDDPLFTLANQHLLAVIGEIVRGDATDHGIGFASFEIELSNSERRRTVRCLDNGAIDSVKNVFLAREGREVILFGQRDGEDALLNIVEIDADFERFFFLVLLVFVLVFIFVGVVFFLLIAQRYQRGWKIFAENGDVDGTRDGMADAGHVDPTAAESDVGGGEEEEILAGLVESRRGSIT